MVQFLPSDVDISVMYIRRFHMGFGFLEEDSVRKSVRY